MKLFTLSIGFFLCSIICNAQLVLTPDGFVSATDESKRYVVYEFKGLMQDYLYSRILPFAKEHFTNPVDNIIEQEPRQVLVEAKGVNKIGIGPIKGNILYRLSIGMEDGKLGYEVQELSFSNAELVESGDTEKAYIFNQDGRVHNPELKQQVEEYFNKMINRINMYIEDTANVDWDL